jgi:tetratricopeptide (TPR) repeat protein
MSVADYLEHYDATWAELMQKQDQFPLQEYGERSVLTTWTMSYEQVKDVDPLAAQLLNLWAFLYHGDVWAELVLTGQGDEAQRRPHEDVFFGPVTKLSLQHSIGTLVQYSMVNMSAADRAPTIHPVVHTWCLHSLDRSTAQRLTAAAIRLVARMAASVGQGVGKDLGLRLAAHAKVIGARVAICPPDEGEQALECHQIAYFLTDWEKSKEVENLYLRALRGDEKAWGAEHTSTLDTVNNLGNLYADQGKMAEAEAMYVRALRGYEKVWGAEHTSTLDTVNNLGLLYADQGKMAEAEAMYVRALRGFEKAWGAEHTSTLETVNNLGLLYADQGKMAEAEEMCVRALRGKEKAWGAKHTSTLETVNNLGSLYKNQGKMAEAETMYIRALRGFEKAWGAEHTSTLDTVNNLGILYKDQGKIAEAEAMYLQALRGYKKLSWVSPARIESVKQDLLSLRKRSDRLPDKRASESTLRPDYNGAMPPATFF